MAYRLAPEAEIDLDDIWYYIAKESNSIRIADRLRPSHRFHHGGVLFARYLPTHWTPPRRRLAARTGSFPVSAYVIIYRVEDHDVLILRVIRGSRDIEALFRR